LQNNQRGNLHHPSDSCECAAVNSAAISFIPKLKEVPDLDPFRIAAHTEWLDHELETRPTTITTAYERLIRDTPSQPRTIPQRDLRLLESIRAIYRLQGGLRERLERDLLAGFEIEAGELTAHLKHTLRRQTSTEGITRAFGAGADVILAALPRIEVRTLKIVSSRTSRP
jgi:hypothetical protein